MAEILGLGITHYPPLIGPDEHMADILRWTLEDPAIPEVLRTAAGWPEPMRKEYGDDGATAAAVLHRGHLVDGLRRCREALDAFNPDVVLIWGDDQYENFTEEVVPAFCILAHDDIEFRPFEHQRHPNIWGEPPETTFRVPGNRAMAKALATGLLEESFDVAYSYQAKEGAPFPHAFANSILYLDYDRRGFPYPVVPFSVNCYGRHAISRKGGFVRFADAVTEAQSDPPSPTPNRCFALGAATARVLADSPWRVALIASSSWSHAFLNDKDWHLYPDIDADRRLYEAMISGATKVWESAALSEVESAGQQELLNWFCLVGAMSQLSKRTVWTSFVETYALNSTKCFAIYGPQ